MNFLVLNRHAAENCKLTVPHVFVSIYSQGCKPATLPTNNLNCGGAIQLQFDDVEKDEILSDNFNTYHLKAITDNQAKIIWSFVDAQLAVEPEQLVVVHCDAGVSRSPAVAAALSLYYLGHDQEYFDRYRPNRKVYRTMLRNMPQCCQEL